VPGVSLFKFSKLSSVCNIQAEDMDHSAFPYPSSQNYRPCVIYTQRRTVPGVSLFKFSKNGVVPMSGNDGRSNALDCESLANGAANSQALAKERMLTGLKS
jgi:hypothetical protein